MAEIQLPISHPYSNTKGVKPTAGNLQVAQIAINTADKKLFTKTPAGDIISVGGGGGGIPLVTCAETTATATLTATAEEISELLVGQCVNLVCPFANVANATLNISGLGAKPIYFKGGAISAGIIPANSPVMLVYETTSLLAGCWRVVSDIYVDQIEWDSVAETIDQILNGSVEVSTDKLGTADVGSATKPIYLEAGYPKAVGGSLAVDITGNATTATSATKATQDGSGNTITSTYVKNAGSRGSLAGYETVGTTATINQASPDSNEVGTAVTIQNGTAGTSWTKIVRLTAEVTVTLGSGWVWQGGSAPTIATGGILVCCWCGSGGMANFVSPS